MLGVLLPWVTCPGIATITERPPQAQPFYSKRVNVASSLVHTDLHGLRSRIEGGAGRADDAATEVFAGAAESDAHSGKAGFECGAPQPAGNAQPRVKLS